MSGLLVAAARFADWEARADEPEIQELIRESIGRGEIRVRLSPEGRTRIITTREARAAMERETGMRGSGDAALRAGGSLSRLRAR